MKICVIWGKIFNHSKLYLYDKKILYSLVLCAMSFSSVAQTQQVDLMNNEWYIHKVVLNGVQYLAPINQERADWQVNSSEFLFNAAAIYLYYCTSCTLQGINFLPNNEFNVDDMVCLAMNDCNRQLGNIVFKSGRE